MNQAASGTNASLDRLPSELIEMGTVIATLPGPQRGRLELLYQRVVESTRRRNRILGLVQDALGQLRLDMKYLLFDLEATRRERDEYRRAMEQGGQDDQPN